MIKTTNAELLAASSALRILVPKEIDVTAALQARRVIDAIQPLVRNYNEELAKILERNGVKIDEARNGKMVDGSPLPDEFLTEATELLNVKIEVDVAPVQSGDLARSKRATVTIDTLHNLGSFLSR